MVEIQDLSWAVQKHVMAARAEREKKKRKKLKTKDYLISRCNQCGAWQFDNRCGVNHGA